MSFISTAVGWSSSPCVESARAFTGFHKGVEEDFLPRLMGPLTKTTATLRATNAPLTKNGVP